MIPSCRPPLLLLVGSIEYFGGDLFPARRRAVFFERLLRRFDFGLVFVDDDADVAAVFGRELGFLFGFVVARDFRFRGRRRFGADGFLDLGAQLLQADAEVDVFLGELRFFEEFRVGLRGGEVLFFDRREFVFDLFFGDRDAQFFGLAFDPGTIRGVRPSRSSSVLRICRCRAPAIFFSFAFGGFLDDRAFQVPFADLTDFGRARPGRGRRRPRERWESRCPARRRSRRRGRRGGAPNTISAKRRRPADLSSRPPDLPL